jgi:DNA-binding IclR family transcriptional regulator
MTQIAEKIGINKSTVHRLLATLEANKFVERDPLTGMYSPGNRLLQVAFLTLEKNNLTDIASPYMQQLNEIFQETVTLSILDESDVVYLSVLESPQKIMLAAKPGQRLPAFCTASGKVLMAYSNDEVIQKIFNSGLPEYTNTTVRDTEKLRQIFHKIREQGFSYSEQEYEEGVNAVASPLFGKDKRPLAAIAVVGPAYRMSIERMLEIGPAVASVAKELSKDLESLVFSS